MNFKEYVAQDINKTFENQNEFSETASINGVDVKIVEDSDKLLYRITKNYDGLVIGDVLFYISVEEYNKIPHMATKPVANQSINYKGKPAIITSINEDMGMYEIILQYASGGFR